MHNISIEEIEEKIEAGEEVIDCCFDSATTRVGTRRQMASRRKHNIEPTKVEIPSSMLTELDTMAKELNISISAVIKMMLRRALDEHYLAKQQIKSEM
ncbi:MAG: ribbon-helix-helix protein, CopG family [Symploca sp. SIO2G7]|nr:ribbon-helix-helix protein, CopG family [Symploca sp. SIO2G7]